MYATIPIYYPSLEEAERNNEKEMWLESYQINMDCKHAIEDRAATAMTSRELDSLIEDLIQNYGVERAMYVLSRTVQFREWDERFSEIVKNRAGAFEFPDAAKADIPGEKNQDDQTQGYLTELDPCVLDLMYQRLMQEEGGCFSDFSEEKAYALDDSEISDEVLEREM